MCCTCWKSLERDKNQLFYKPAVVTFRKRKLCKIEVSVNCTWIKFQQVHQANRFLKKYLSPEPQKFTSDDCQQQKNIVGVDL